MGFFMNIEDVRTKIKQYPLSAIAMALVSGVIISHYVITPKTSVAFSAPPETFFCLTESNSDGDQKCVKYGINPYRKITPPVSNAACPSPVPSCP